MKTSRERIDDAISACSGEACERVLCASQVDDMLLEAIADARAAGFAEAIEMAAKVFEPYNNDRGRWAVECIRALAAKDES